MKIKYLRYKPNAISALAMPNGSSSIFNEFLSNFWSRDTLVNTSVNHLTKWRQYDWE